MSARGELVVLTGVDGPRDPGGDEDRQRADLEDGVAGTIRVEPQPVKGILRVGVRDPPPDLVLGRRLRGRLCWPLAPDHAP